MFFPLSLMILWAAGVQGCILHGDIWRCPWERGWGKEVDTHGCQTMNMFILTSKLSPQWTSRPTLTFYIVLRASPPPFSQVVSRSSSIVCTHPRGADKHLSWWLLGSFLKVPGKPLPLGISIPPKGRESCWTSSSLDSSGVEGHCSILLSAAGLRRQILWLASPFSICSRVSRPSAAHHSGPQGPAGHHIYDWGIHTLYAGEQSSMAFFTQAICSVLIIMFLSFKWCHGNFVQTVSERYFLLHILCLFFNHLEMIFLYIVHCNCLIAQICTLFNVTGRGCMGGNRVNIKYSVFAILWGFF